MPEPVWLEILKQSFPAALTSVAAFAITAKSTRGVEQIRTIDPDHSGFQLRSHLQRDVDALTPDACGQTIHGIVRQFDSLARCAERHGRQHWTKNFLLGHD